MQGDYIDYKRKKAVRADGTEEVIECSDKIKQYNEQTTIYCRDNAEIEVTLTNNEAIAEISKDIKELEEQTSKTEKIVLNYDVYYRKVGQDEVEISANSSGQNISIVANNVAIIGTLDDDCKPTMLIDIPVVVLIGGKVNNTSCTLYCDTDGVLKLCNRTANAITVQGIRVYFRYYTD